MRELLERVERERAALARGEWEPEQMQHFLSATVPLLLERAQDLPPLREIARLANAIMRDNATLMRATVEVSDLERALEEYYA